MSNSENIQETLKKLSESTPDEAFKMRSPEYKSAQSETLRSTMKIRWSKTVFYDGSIGEYCRELQQCFLNEHGVEVWKAVEIEK